MTGFERVLRKQSCGLFLARGVRKTVVRSSVQKTKSIYPHYHQHRVSELIHQWHEIAVIDLNHLIGAHRRVDQKIDQDRLRLYSSCVYILKIRGVRLVEVFENSVVAFVYFLVPEIRNVYMIGFYQPTR